MKKWIDVKKRFATLGSKSCAYFTGDDQLGAQCKDQRTLKGRGNMVKFLCDLCGRDISEKVYDSIKQFCEKDHFEQKTAPGVTADLQREAPGIQHETDFERGRLCLDVQLLRELSKLIHASAWSSPTTTMKCSQCAIEGEEKKRGKIITIFTRIADKQLLTETPAMACSQEN